MLARQNRHLALDRGNDDADDVAGNRIALGRDEFELEGLCHGSFLAIGDRRMAKPERGLAPVFTDPQSRLTVFASRSAPDQAASAAKTLGLLDKASSTEPTM